MKKGINVWSLPKGLSLCQQFEAVKQAGFHTIELNLEEAEEQENFLADELLLTQQCGLSRGISTQELDDILQLAEHYQLPISSISTGLHWKYPLSSSNAILRETGEAIVREMIDICSYLGGDTVLVVPGLVTEEISYDQCYERAQASLKKLAAYAEEKQIMIGIENVWNKFLLSPIEMKQFIDEIDSKMVKVYFDAGNVLQFGYPEQWVRILKQRIAKVHIKDYDTTIGNIQGFTSLLNGDLNWKKLMEALAEIGYDGPLTCEVGPYKYNGLQTAKDCSRSLDYILNVLKQEEHRNV